MTGNPPPLPRLVAEPLCRIVATSPVVAVTGARQTGKTTLVQMTDVATDADYLTLDDLDALEAADRTPDDLVNRAPRLVIDEVQRSPDLLLAIKRAVDRDRTPGRFILTGSANLLLMRRLSETLAGRANYLTLHPLTRRELLGLGSCGIWSSFFAEDFADWHDVIRSVETPYQDWEDLATRGGYPTPAYHLEGAEARNVWFAGYVRTYLERDLQELAAIDQLADFRRFMRVCTLRVGNLLNQADLARDVGIPPTTAQRYLGLLETSYQAIRLPAFAVNRTKRLTKAPKLYWGDTGLSMHLAGETEARGAHFENLILNDLLAWRDAELQPPEIQYWRTTKGAEVDFVIEWRGGVVAVEVKASNRVTTGDAKHLRAFLDEYRDLARGGLILYTGDRVQRISREILAAPWWLVV